MPNEPTGTFACPICGQDTPHSHSYEEAAAYRAQQKLETVYDLVQKFVDEHRIESEEDLFDISHGSFSDLFVELAKVVGYHRPEEAPSNIEVSVRVAVSVVEDSGATDDGRELA